MSGKRFAHFLVSGKLALGTMVLPITGPLGSVGGLESAFAESLVTETQLHVVELANGAALEVHNAYPTGMYGVEVGEEAVVTHAATLNIPGPECTYSAAQAMDLVITGIKPGENIYVVMGASLDDPNLKASIGDNFRIGSDRLSLLAIFSTGSVTSMPGSEITANFNIDLSATFSSVKLKVDIANLAPYAGEEVYIQVVSLPPGASPGDWGAARFSEVDTIKIEEDLCEAGPYGGKGIAY